MNFFEILTSGDGNINEPNITSVLAFLLDPSKDHGFKDSFLKIFLRDSIKNDKLRDFVKALDFFSFNTEDIEVEVDVEKQFSGEVRSERKRRDIDIVLSFYHISQKEDEEQKTKFLVVAIENKIRVSSGTDVNQLTDEFTFLAEHTLSEVDGTENSITDRPCIEFVYLTPNIENQQLAKNFNFLNELISNQSQIERMNDRFYASATHIQWEDFVSSKRVSMLSMLKELLEKERAGEIDSASPFALLLVKNFITFIKRNIDPRTQQLSPYWQLPDNSAKPVGEADFWESWGNKHAPKKLAKSIFSKFKEYNCIGKTTSSRLVISEPTGSRNVCNLMRDHSTKQRLSFILYPSLEKGNYDSILDENNLELPNGIAYVISSSRKKITFEINIKSWNDDKESYRKKFIETLIDITGIAVTNVNKT